MEYTDGNKKYTIEPTERFDGRGPYDLYFEFKMTDPVELDNRLVTVSKIKTESGRTGLRFDAGDDISIKLSGNKKKPVLITLTDDAIEFMRETNAQKLMEKEENAKATEPKVWYWAVSGDTHKLYFTQDEVDKFYRPDLQAIADMIEKKVNAIDLEPHSRKSGRSTALYAPDGWYEIDDPIVREIFARLQEEKAAKLAEKDAKISAIFAKARETGKPQIISRWSEACNDPHESCDIDNIVEYAMPDGSRKTERHHTW